MKMLPFEFEAKYSGKTIVYGIIPVRSNNVAKEIRLDGLEVDGTLEEWLPRIEAHNNACLAADEAVNKGIASNRNESTVLRPEAPPSDPFADRPVKPGDLVEYSGRVLRVLQAEEKESGVISIHSFIFSDENLYQLKDWISINRFRILTPAEVEAHERKLRYPVLAPGDVVKVMTYPHWYYGQVFECSEAPPKATENIVFIGAFGYTQEECAAKIESGEWVKYVREVKP